MKTNEEETKGKSRKIWMDDLLGDMIMKIK